MWLPSKIKGEYAVDIGAKVKFSESGQIQVVDDDGNVSLNTIDAVRLGMPR